MSDSRPRGYRGIRLSRAMRSGFSQSATNHGTHSLYNNSQGQFYLVVRALSFFELSGADVAQLVNNKGTLGTHQGTEAHMIMDHAPGPGQHYFLDSAAQLTGDFEFAVYQAPNPWPNIPLAVIPPGYSLAVQLMDTTLTTRCGFIWEYVTVDELDLYFV
jgi:hypothetical protein